MKARAKIGDTLATDVRLPFPHTISMTLATPESVAYANELLLEPSPLWRLVPKGNQSNGNAGERHSCIGDGAERG